MAAVIGKDIGRQIAEIFGLKQTRSFQINVGMDEAVSITVEFLPTPDQMKGFVQVLQKYELHAKKSDG